MRKEAPPQPPANGAFPALICRSLMQQWCLLEDQRLVSGQNRGSDCVDRPAPVEGREVSLVIERDAPGGRPAV